MSMAVEVPKGLQMGLDCPEIHHHRQDLNLVLIGDGKMRPWMVPEVLTLGRGIVGSSIESYVVVCEAHERMLTPRGRQAHALTRLRTKI